MRILIVKLGSIGDVVHTLPALALIRHRFPKASIFWAVEEKSFPLLEHNPLLDEIICVKKTEVSEFTISIRQLRRLKPEIALDFQGLLKSALIAKLSGADRRIGFASEMLREPASRFFLTETVDILKDKVHVIEKNMTLAGEAFNIEFSFPEQLEFPIFTDESHKNEAQEVINRISGNFAILNPAGGWGTKLWRAENFGLLADKLWEEFGIWSVVTTAKDEEHIAEKVLSSSRTKKAIKATLSLKGFYELAKQAKVYVGGDTGPTHIAVAAGAPVVGIFGPTEWWRNGSPYHEDICVERKDIACRINCHRRVCDNWICMDISVETVFEAVRERFEKVCLRKSLVWQ